MRKKFVLMFFFFHVSSSEKHSLENFCVGFSGIPNFPVYLGTAEVDGIEAAYCDSNQTLRTKQDWLKSIMQTEPDPVDWLKRECFENRPFLFKAMINNLMQGFGQSDGVHVLQVISGCEWDDETGEVDGFMKYGYDGEDFLSFDVKSLTWIALKPEAVATKLSLEADLYGLKFYEHFLTQVFPEWLKKYFAKSSLLRTVLPSVSLLQKSPSSPVTCHATGFYPDRAVIFWRRDGEELFEDVEHGEILPNHDGSFQMSVDLLRLPSEDWRRYECVFQLDGVKEDIVTKLHKDVIRTNHSDSSIIIITIIIIAAVCCLLLAGAAYKYHRAPGSESSPETSSELSERLRADG